MSTKLSITFLVYVVFWLIKWHYSSANLAITSSTYFWFLCFQIWLKILGGGLDESMDGAIQRKGQNDQLILNSSDLLGIHDNCLHKYKALYTNLSFSLMNEPMLDQIDSQWEGFDATLTLKLFFILLHFFSQMTFHVLV